MPEISASVAALQNLDDGSGFLIGWENGTASPEVGSDVVEGGIGIGAPLCSGWPSLVSMHFCFVPRLK